MNPYIRNRILGGVLVMGIPVAFMEYEHIHWEPTLPEKIRIAMKHTGFWSGLGTAFALMHRKFTKQLVAQSFFKALPIYLGLSVLPLLGYLGMSQLASIILPTQSVEPNQTTNKNLSVDSPSIQPINPQYTPWIPQENMPQAPQPYYYAPYYSQHPAYNMQRPWY